MSEPLPVIDADTTAAAVHGSYCPKLCTYACPVASATGREDAVPWSFHRTVADLSEGRLAPSPAVATRLTACTGCLACQVPCLFDQDVPAQIRAGRRALQAAGVLPEAVSDAVAQVASGRAPDGRAIVPEDVAGSGPGDATCVLLVGCRDDAQLVRDAVTLLEQAGARPQVVVPSGCCGATLRDLGDAAAAQTAVDALAARFPAEGLPVVALDPHCLPEAQDAAGEGTLVEHVTVTLARLVEEGRLRLDDRRLGPVRYHDPCLLARGHAVTAEPRALLAAAGATLVEPEHTGVETACSGAGMGLELLDEAAAEATAARRRIALLAGGPATIVTACSGARRRLAADGTAVHDLLHLLASAGPAPAPSSTSEPHA